MSPNDTRLKPVTVTGSTAIAKESIRLEESTEERRRKRETQETEMVALQIRLLKIQIAEKDTEANKRKKATRQMAAASKMAKGPENAVQKLPTVQTRVMPEIQNRQKGGRDFRFEGCYHCNQMGHWARECPQNIAPNNDPPCSYQQGGRGGFRGKGRGRGGGVQNGGCFRCGQMAHWSNECPLNQLQQPKAPQYFPTPFQKPQRQQYNPKFQTQQTPVYVPTQSQPPTPVYKDVQFQHRGGHSGGRGFQGQPRGGMAPNMN